MELPLSLGWGRPFCERDVVTFEVLNAVFLVSIVEGGESELESESDESELEESELEDSDDEEDEEELEEEELEEEDEEGERRIVLRIGRSNGFSSKVC